MDCISCAVSSPSTSIPSSAAIKLFTNGNRSRTSLIPSCTRGNTNVNNDITASRPTLISNVPPHTSRSVFSISPLTVRPPLRLDIKSETLFPNLHVQSLDHELVVARPTRSAVERHPEAGHPSERLLGQ